MTHPLSISVIIPTWNRVQTLVEAIESVLNQSLLPQEIIVVDDGSNDDTASEIPSRFPEITFLKQKNQGVAAARNRGVGASRCDWIAFLDSDDLWDPKKLEIQWKAIKSQGEYAIFFTREKWFKQKKKMETPKHLSPMGGWIFDQCLERCAIGPSSLILSREIFDSIGGFDEKMTACEDYDLGLRLCDHAPCFLNEQALTIKRAGQENQLSSTVPALDRFRLYALLKFLARPDQGQVPHLQIAKKMALKKSKILYQGAKKRERADEFHTIQKGLEDENLEKTLPWLIQKIELLMIEEDFI